MIYSHSGSFHSEVSVAVINTVMAISLCPLDYIWNDLYSPDMKGTPVIQVLKVEDSGF